ncbi:MAG TPA: FecR domain-containing protein [Pyrinomonadaceae bacterium]|nr:FecR domain-containing protein [Pyrinomonadaceae bacterium]
MKRNNKELDAILDRVAANIRDEQIDSTVMNDAAARVWARVAADAGEVAPVVSASETISGCADYQSLMPAYTAGELTQARALLLEDHTRECIPCRKALKAARTGTAVPATRAARVRPSQTSVRSSFTPAWRWSIAAGLLLCVGVSGLFFWSSFFPGSGAMAATVESVDGTLYSVNDDASRVLAPGDKVKAGERVRSAKETAAVLRLNDGSSVELRERSEFSVSEGSGGTTVRLERGDVLVEAAKQRERHLYVSTPDTLVAVTGTIFSVGSGTKGSRVSVVEGEVKVRNAGAEKTLKPGEQATTHPSLERIPVVQEIAWSRNSARYARLVGELTRLRQDINQRAPRPGVRYTSRFLDLVPENTVLYAALPNLAATFVESHRIMQERIKQNPALAEWWKGQRGEGHGADSQVIDSVRELGALLGEEIVVSATLDARGEPGNILVLGELKDSANFRSQIEQQLARHSKGGPAVRFVEDPLTYSAPAAAAPAKPSANGAKARPEPEALYVWVRQDLFAASPQVEQLRALASAINNPGANRFAGTPFHSRLAEIYKEGAGLVVAADLERIIGQAVQRESAAPDSARKIEGFRQLGVLSLRHFAFEQKEVKAKTQSRAVLSFGEPRRGIVSWLAEPGPMGALEFVSPEANVAAAFVVKEPTMLVDDLLGFLETVEPNLRKQLRELEAQQGFDIRRDFAAPLGGEFAFAVDGPLLPTPSWKMVLEVYDQPRLQQTFERVIEKLNAWAVLQGKQGLRWENTTEGGRTFYALKSVDFGMEVHYTYANGYLVAGPSRGLIDRALKFREAGSTLLRSPRFTSALPEDGNANFSAVFYHDLAPLVKPFADSAAGARLPEQQRQALAALATDAPPTLAYAYARGDSVTLAANTEGGPFGLGPASLLGLPNSFAIQHILMSAMGDKANNPAGPQPGNANTRND